MIPIEAALTLSEDDLARDDLRNPDVAQAASKVAVIAEGAGRIAGFPTRFRRTCGWGGVGWARYWHDDLPRCACKLFVTASAEARAKRRYDELIEQGRMRRWIRY